MALTLHDLQQLMQQQGVTELYAKALAENDNSKQQVYLGGGYSALNVLPIGEPRADTSTRTPQVKATLELYWLNTQGEAALAPHTKVVLYPQYPEVRLSGFLLGCPLAPSHLLQPPKVRLHGGQPDGRVWFFGVTAQRKVYSYLAEAGSTLALEFFTQSGTYGRDGVFYVLPIAVQQDNKALLLAELGRIHKLGLIAGQRLKAGGVLMPYIAPNGGGYTLEAELGIVPNGISEPDYLGWEVKGHSDNTLTLMTPEPTGGDYLALGVEGFMRRHGRITAPNTHYFTGPYRVGGVKFDRQLRLEGFDAATGKFSLSGSVQLVQALGAAELILAQWDYPGLLGHWSRKHSKAVYVRYKKGTLAGATAYQYRSPVFLAEGTDFGKFLQALHGGQIFYDPGVKLEIASGQAKTKRRSQFRVKFKDLPTLYDSFVAHSIT